MGLSSTSALIGLLIAIAGGVLLIRKKHRKWGITLVILGLVLIVIPGTLIYLFLD